MKVYRLESPDGQGVYSNGAARTICEKLDNENLAFDLSYHHPMPRQDSKLIESVGAKSGDTYVENGKFGFTSYDQYRAWFYSDEFLEKCEEYKLLLCVYEAETVYEGFTQCIFLNGKKVSEHSPLVAKEELE